ncbi:chemotaxis protein CheW [Desulfuromonas sp. AOP6]|uniref:chemotaxis protein CheW n=1 Tax=Desulfuromonas sp. AOP6 TaxID=1566351 RepID=UPI001BCD0239|nr:chemotaxis protein CheW [Desulfuromonas sp. AOP6]
MRNTLLPVFLEEALENFGNIEKCLQSLGKIGDSGQELLEPAFRSAHTIKGTAGLVKLAETSTIARRLEEALETLNLSGNIPSSAEVKVLNLAFEVLREQVRLTSENQPERTGAAAEVDQALREAEAATRRPSFSVVPQQGGEEPSPLTIPMERIVPAAAEPTEPPELEALQEEAAFDALQESIEFDPDEENSTRVALRGFACCHFQVAGVEYYLPMENMLEISPLPPLTRLPLAPDYIQGLANLRGSVVPVIHLGRLNGHRGAASSDRHLVIAISGTEKIGFIAESMPNLSMETPGEVIHPSTFIQKFKIGAA